MDLLDKLRSIDRRLADYEPGAAIPGLTVIARVIGPCEVVVGGRPTLMFGSNNYLGLTLHPEVVNAAREALNEYGTGTTGSRTANGTLALHEELEEELAEWFGKRHAIIFSTGYQASLSLIGGLCGPDDVILIDGDSHASIYDATRRNSGSTRNGRGVGSADQPRCRRSEREDLMRHLLRFVGALLIVALPSIAAAQDKFFNSNGVQLRYVEQGTGDPIVLVHGYTVNTELSWIETGIMANLAKDYRVIALDNRGHGKSGKPHDPKAYGNEMSEDIVRLLDHLNIQRAHIVGYSYGGRITAKLLTTHTERFITATLGGSAGERNSTPEIDRAVEVQAAEIERGNFRAVVLAIAPTDRPTPTDEAIRHGSERILDYGNDQIALAALWRARRGLAVTDAQLAAVRVPTLAVVGSADARLTDVNQLKTVMPSLKVVVLQGAVHSISDERGAQRRPEFVNAIREFIASQKVGSRTANR